MGCDVVYPLRRDFRIGGVGPPGFSVHGVEIKSEAAGRLLQLAIETCFESQIFDEYLIINSFRAFIELKSILPYNVRIAFASRSPPGYSEIVQLHML